MTATDGQASPGFAAAQERLGRRLLQEGKHEPAAESFRKAISNAPEAVGAWVGLGVALRFRGEFDAALRAFDQAISLEPDNVEANFGLANLRRARGEPALAAQLYQRVLELEPDHAEALYFLAVVTPGETPASIPATLVRDLFDAYAPTYDDHLLRSLHYQAPRLLRESVDRWVGASKAFPLVMDLGCGTGLCGPLFRGIATRLIGVDLSPRMIEMARKRGVYNELAVGDLCVALRARQHTIDLAVAADVVMYLGDLSLFLSSSEAGLREGGRLVFTAEVSQGSGPYELLQGGRFAHRREYIEELAAENGLDIEGYERVVSRVENGRSVVCHLFLLANRRPSVTGCY